MAVSPSPDQLVTGRVASVNPKGVRLEDHADWFNCSRFASDIMPPMRGQTVTLTLDRQGFVRAVATSGGPQQQPAQGRHEPQGQRDTTITRLACLKAAAEFGASRQQLNSGDVLKIAQSWERWVTRDVNDQTDDAF
jgi:hypothetical protein